MQKLFKGEVENKQKKEFLFHHTNNNWREKHTNKREKNPNSKNV